MSEAQHNLFVPSPDKKESVLDPESQKVLEAIIPALGLVETEEMQLRRVDITRMFWQGIKPIDLSEEDAVPNPLNILIGEYHGMGQEQIEEITDTTSFLRAQVALHLAMARLYSEGGYKEGFRIVTEDIRDHVAGLREYMESLMGEDPYIKMKGFLNPPVDNQ